MFGRHRAGRSTLAEFRRRRRHALRTEWKGWTVFVALLAGALAATWWFDGFFELVFAGFVGALLMLFAVAWMTGFDLRSMPWLWGSWGEQWTEEELDRLSDAWLVEHDVPRERGNWDHIVVGPPGIFLLDSKHLREPAWVEADVLRAGGMRYEGRVFRRQAVQLSELLEQRLGSRPWVQAVAVVWGAFPDRVVEAERVAYVHGRELVAWLEQQPERVPSQRRRMLFDTIGELREAVDAPHAADTVPNSH